MNCNYIKMITVVKITLGFLMLIFLGFFARNLFTTLQGRDITPVASTHVEPGKQENKSFQEYESIPQKNQFGIPTDSLRFNTSEGSAALSDIKLIGTMSVSVEHSYAVFVGKDGKQALFKTGAPIFGAGKLRTVETDSVIIESNSKFIKIRMVSISASGDPEVPSVAKETSEPMQSLGGGEYIRDQEAFQLVLNDPERLARDVWRTHHMTDDKHGGYILGKVRKKSIFDNFGMKQDDVLLRINDYNISSPENALQAFTVMKGIDKVQLEIIRDGNRMTMNYQIR
jgi:type II secretion system protein C